MGKAKKLKAMRREAKQLAGDGAPYVEHATAQWDRHYHGQPVIVVGAGGVKKTLKCQATELAPDCAKYRYKRMKRGKT